MNLAFSLIELLVVISLLVLLMSLMLPALRQAREAARSAKCLGQLRHWGIVHSAYAMDFKGLLPPAVDRENPALDSFGAVVSFSYHPGIIQRGGYHGQRGFTSDKIDVNWCPSDPEIRYGNTATQLGGGTMTNNPWAPFITKYVVKGSSYGLNPTLKAAWAVRPGPGGQSVRWSEGKYWRPRDIIAPLAKVPVMGDTRSFVFLWGSSGSGYMFTPFYGLATRHGSGSFYDGNGDANVLMADGHAITMRAQLINPNWNHWSYSGWDSLPLQHAGLTWYFGGYQNSTFAN
jgi:prepilin-type processing-associated H-X9-DG protein